MRHCLLLVLLFAWPVQFASANAKSDAQQVTIVIQPTEQLFPSQEQVLLEVSISNHSRKNLVYETCPRPYQIVISDRSGNVVQPKPKGVPEPSVDEAGKVTYVVDMPLCSSFSGIIKPGSIWKQQVAPAAGLSLMPTGIYSVQIVWTFTTGKRKIGGHETPITLQVSSNRTDVAIGQ